MCANLSFNKKMAAEARCSRAKWGELGDGTDVTKVELAAAELKVTISSYGVQFLSVETKDRDGKFADVVMSYDSLEKAVKGKENFSSVVGRYGNRIGGASFMLGGEQFNLAANNGENHLHGGPTGFCRRNWEVVEVVTEGEVSRAVFRYTSEDLEEGYPGKLTTTLTVSVTSPSTLRLSYRAETVDGKDTAVNLTNHAYWNLSGHGAGADALLGHQLYLPRCSTFTPVGASLVPSGKLREVKETPLDFTKQKEAHTLGERIGELGADTELGRGTGGGYDFNFCVDRDETDDAEVVVAVLYDPASGRGMRIASDQPGLQVYTANFVNKEQDRYKDPKGGVAAYDRHGAVCLETQNWPDAINHADDGFPNAVLKAGETYKHEHAIEFFVR